MPNIPKWAVKGDWFDTCKCGIPCPCYFAQPPTYGDCEGVLAWHIREGNYGGVPLAGLNVMALGTFTGNIWAGAKATMGIFIDERANERQREALQMIFGGQASTCGSIGQVLTGPEPRSNSTPQNGGTRSLTAEGFLRRPTPPLK